MKNVRKTLPLCDRVYVLDNTSLDNPFEQVATLCDGVLDIHLKVLSEWARELLQDYWIGNNK